MRAATSAVFVSVLAVACNSAPPQEKEPLVPGTKFTITAGKPVDGLPGETHLKNVRQLTFDGENAEAYWSGDGKKLILQRKAEGMPADRIFVLDLTTGAMQQVSSGKGRTTCSYFMQGDRQILFASTHLAGDEPPVVKMTGRGYQWAVYREYDIFTADADGKNCKPLTTTPGYDAEATVCPVTGAIVFTSVRDGDLELYTMERDGSNVKRITNRPGYDGGAFFSHDGSKLVFRSAFPKDDKEAAEDAQLLGQQIVRPSHMEITVVKRDGSGYRQVTNNGEANFAPYWTPDDKRIIFASNVLGMKAMRETKDHKQARNFDLFLVNEDGTNLEQVTHCELFDSFPMFSPDGRYLVFASNRYGAKEGDTNVFVAEWVN